MGQLHLLVGQKEWQEHWGHEQRHKDGKFRKSEGGQRKALNSGAEVGGLQEETRWRSCGRRREDLVTVMRGLGDGERSCRNDAPLGLP